MRERSGVGKAKYYFNRVGSPIPFDMAIIGFITITLILVVPNVGVWYSATASYDIQRRGQIAALILVGLTAACHSRLFKLELTRIHPVVRIIGSILVALGSLSAIWAPRPWIAFRELSLAILLILFSFSVAALARSAGFRFDRFIAGGLLLSASFYISSFLAIRYEDGFAYGAPASFQLLGFANPRFFAQLQSWTLPLITLPLLLFSTENKWGRLLLFLPAVGWWMLAFLQPARGTMLGLAAGVLVTVALFGRSIGGWIWYSASAAIAGLVASYLVLPRPFGSTAGFASAADKGFSSSGRTEIWRHTIALITDHPIGGVGAGHFGWKGNSGSVNVAHPHNSMLQWAAELGVFSAALIVIVCAWGYVHWVIDCRRQDQSGAAKPTRVAVTVAVTAAAVHSLLSGVVVMPVSQTFGAVVVGWAVGIHWRSTEPLPQRWILAPIPRLIIFAACVLLAATAVASDGWETTGELAPRFWIHGRFE